MIRDIWKAIALGIHEARREWGRRRWLRKYSAKHAGF